MQPEEYTVGWICAIGIELAVASALLDERHTDEQKPWIDASRDHNSYTFGRIHDHNVVIAALPQGRYGITAAAVVARDMQTSFSNLQIRLMVGIAGGAPSKKNDIRLGDVVVSSPTSRFGGVIQYDFGKAIQDHEFEATGYLAPPPDDLLNAVAHLKAQHQSEGHRIAEIVADLLEKHPRLKTECSRPALDRLYSADFSHSTHGQCHCQNNVDALQEDIELQQAIIHRDNRPDGEDDPMIHYGLVASANSVMKDAIARDILVARYDVLCFEMEAAGLMNIFPSLVVRGICDYSDSHKNNAWQGYAAATAAAYAKELLGTMTARQSQLSLRPIKHRPETTRRPGPGADIELDQADKDCLAKLHLTTPALDKERIEKRAGGLFKDCYKWILDHDDYQSWLEKGNLLWIKGDPGKGKTMLLCGIIDELTNRYSAPISYFFCQTTYAKTNNNATAVLRGLIWMLAIQNPHLIQHIRDKADSSSESIYTDANSFFVLDKILRSMLQDAEGPILIIDALDECEDGRNYLIDLIRDTSISNRVKWLISSRNWPIIEERLGNAPRLSLEIEKSVEGAVKSYINLKISQLAELKGLSKELSNFVSEYLISRTQGTFLWAALVCTSLQSASKRRIRSLIEELPPTLNALYSRMLGYVTVSEESEILSLILAVTTHVHRPLRISELSNVIELSHDDQESIHELIQECGSFLTIRDDVVEFIHQSAKEYIQKHLPQAIEAKSIHLEIYKSSLRTLSITLRRNIWEAKDIASNIEDMRPSNSDYDPLTSIAYCCLYWAEHLAHSGDLENALRKGSHLSIFLQKHYLFWLEAVALLENIQQATRCMHLLYNTTKDHVNGALTDLVYDAYRYIMHFHLLIAEYPLQVYSSGLLFCPTNSLIKQTYTALAPNWAVMIASPIQDWSAHQTTIKTCWLANPSSTFSSKGNQIAVGGRLEEHMEPDNIYVYDVNTSALLHSTSYRDVLQLVFVEADSKLMFMCGSSSSTTALAIWDLHSNHITELRDFPGHGKLSPDAKHVAYLENDCEENSICCYQIDTGCTSSSLSATNSMDGLCSFSVDGSGVAVWGPVGPIEIWEITSMSRCATIQYQGTAPGDKSLTLSQRSEILAFQCEDVENQTSFKVFSVKSGCLIWQGEQSYGRGIPCFLPEAPILCVPGVGEISLHNTYSGAKLGQIPVWVHRSGSIAVFKHRLAVVDTAEIKLFDIGTVDQTPMSSDCSEQVKEINGNQLIVECNDQIRDIRWIESRDIDSTALLWMTDPVPLAGSGQYMVLCDKKIAIVRHGELVILKLQEGLGAGQFQEQAKFPIPGTYAVTCSPDKSKLSCCTQEEQWLSVFDVISQTMSTATATTTALGGWPVWSPQSDYLVRKHDQDILIWTRVDGFRQFRLQVDVESEVKYNDRCISPSGTLLAIVGNQKSLSDTDTNDSRSFDSKTPIMQIWNLHDGSLTSKFELTGLRFAPFASPVFLPCETRIVLGSNDSIQMWSVSGTLLFRKDGDFKIEYLIYRSSPVEQLDTNVGVIAIQQEGFQLGTATDLFVEYPWIYHNGRRVLWLPPEYSMSDSDYSEGRLVLEHESNRLTVLKFFFDKME